MWRDLFRKMGIYLMQSIEVVIFVFCVQYRIVMVYLGTLEAEGWA